MPSTDKEPDLFEDEGSLPVTDGDEGGVSGVSPESWADLDGEVLLKLFRIVWWMRKHPDGAAFLLLGILMRAPHQALTLRKMWTVLNVILKLSRGMSKTFLLGIFAILKNMLWSGATGIVLGQGMREGKRVLEEAMEPTIDGTLEGQEPREFARRSLRDPTKIIQRERDKYKVRFGKRHTSSTVTGPLGRKGANSPLRGERANAFLLYDESADIDADVRAAVIKPFRNVGRGFGREGSITSLQTHHIEAGTVRYEWQAFTQIMLEHETRMASGSENHLVIEFNYEDGFYHVGNDVGGARAVYLYPIKKHEIEDDKLSGDTDIATWLAENKNVVIAQADTEFPPQLIQRIRNYELDVDSWEEKWLKPELSCLDPCIVGIDPAREFDEFALTVVRLGQEAFVGPQYDFDHVIFSQTLFQATHQEMADFIWEIDDRYNVLFFMMDKGGGGSALRDLLTYPEETSRGVKKTPIYDPDDFDEKDNPLPTELEADGKPTLRLLTYGNEELTLWNNFLKGQMEKSRFLFPRHEYKDPNPEMQDAYRTIYKQGLQFTWIQSKPSGRWKTYVVPNRKLKKDLYSSTIMVAAKLYEMSQEAKREAPRKPLDLFVVLRGR